MGVHPLMRRAVFLDRDGVLNRTRVSGGVPRPPASAEEIDILPGVADALGALRRRGFLLVVVTNQPDVARGTQTRETVEAINTRLTRALGLDAVFTCYHDTGDGCGCRKPEPGLLRQAALVHGIDLPQSYLVGDRWSDVAAGRAAGCTTFLADGPHSQRDRCQPDHVVRDLAEAARTILGRATDPMEGTDVVSLDQLRIKIFADGADRDEMVAMAKLPHIAGFTTNPTLMRKAGVRDYRAFALDVLKAIPDRPISFEVFSDDFDEMERQAEEIASWAPHVYVKIPITNTRGAPAYPLIRRLARAGAKLNVTAILTRDQIQGASESLAGGPPSIISVFAGRIADTGRDPVPLMASAVDLVRPHPSQELLWASPRELLNVFQADALGCHIITATADILNKLRLVGKDLAAYSLETVQMFYRDAAEAGYRLQ